MSPFALVQVRPAAAADAPDVVRLLVAQLREHDIGTPEEDVRRTVAGWLARPHRARFLLAVADGAPIGVAAVSFAWAIEHGARSIWFEELYVVPEARGSGTGSRLLRAVLALAAEVGATAVDLEVETSHRRAADLYAREGFRELPRTHWVKAIAPVPAPAPPAVPSSSGGCLCGAVRWRASEPPIEVVHCHCTLCRRASGAPLVTWATFPRAAVTVTGTPAERRSTPDAVRSFCRDCGTPIAFSERARPTVIDITVGSMDHPEQLRPAGHIWTRGALPWLAIDDDLPRHDGANPAER
jgi:GNAT superfamily N-acetyltransferase